MLVAEAIVGSLGDHHLSQRLERGDVGLDLLRQKGPVFAELIDVRRRSRWSPPRPAR